MVRDMVDWAVVRAVIFDVDGTLYDQKILRRRMLRDLATHYMARPWKVREVTAIIAYRKIREEMAGVECESDIAEALYRKTAERCGIGIDCVREIVLKWILRRPLGRLHEARFPGLLEFIQALRDKNIQLFAFSDYPAREKLERLGLPPMPSVCSTDSNVNCLKPHPRGLSVALDRLGLEAQDCLLLGDRDEHDGECARRVGMPYLIKTAAPRGDEHFSSYVQLLNSIPHPPDFPPSGEPLPLADR